MAKHVLLSKSQSSEDQRLVVYISDFHPGCKDLWESSKVNQVSAICRFLALVHSIFVSVYGKNCSTLGCFYFANLESEINNSLSRQIFKALYFLELKYFGLEVCKKNFHAPRGPQVVNVSGSAVCIIKRISMTPAYWFSPYSNRSTILWWLVWNAIFTRLLCLCRNDWSFLSSRPSFNI